MGHTIRGWATFVRSAFKDFFDVSNNEEEGSSSAGCSLRTSLRYKSPLPCTQYVQTDCIHCPCTKSSWWFLDTNQGPRSRQRTHSTGYSLGSVGPHMHCQNTPYSGETSLLPYP